MNLFQLVFKQMRQRALSTWLTTLSVALGVGLACAVLLLRSGGEKLLAQSDFGFELVVGPSQSSKLELVLNTVYQVNQAQGTVPYSVLDAMSSDRKMQALISQAVPISVGDYVNGLRVIGTTQRMFGFDSTGKPAEFPFRYRVGKAYEFEQGRVFAKDKFEAVVGADVPRMAKLQMESTFKVSHGSSDEKADVHDEQWKVVGVLKKTHTAADRLIYIPLLSFYAIPDHGKGLEQNAAQRALAGGTAMLKSVGIGPAAPKPTHTVLTAMDKEIGLTLPHSKRDEELAPEVGDHAGHNHAHHDMAYHVLKDGTIHLELAKEKLAVSAILVKARGGATSGFQTEQLKFIFRNSPDAVAASPAAEMYNFFETYMKRAAQVLLAISILVSVVAGVGILVGIYNSVSARTKEIAILRALGATKAKVLTIITLEAVLIGVIGSIAGLVLAVAMAGVGSYLLNAQTGQGFDYLALGKEHLYYLLGVVGLSVIAGLMPALKAYQTPVAGNLV